MEHERQTPRVRLDAFREPNERQRQVDELPLRDRVPEQVCMSSSSRVCISSASASSSTLGHLAPTAILSCRFEGATKWVLLADVRRAIQPCVPILRARRHGTWTMPSNPSAGTASRRRKFADGDRRPGRASKASCLRPTRGSWVVVPKRKPDHSLVRFLRVRVAVRRRLAEIGAGRARVAIS